MGCLLKWSYLLCQPWHTVILPIMHFSQNTFVRVHTGYYYPAQIGRKFSLYWKKNIYIYNINNIGMLLWSKLKYPKFTLFADYSIAQFLYALSTTLLNNYKATKQCHSHTEVIFFHLWNDSLDFSREGKTLLQCRICTVLKG